MLLITVLLELARSTPALKIVLVAYPGRDFYFHRQDVLNYDDLWTHVVNRCYSHQYFISSILENLYSLY